MIKLILNGKEYEVRDEGRYLPAAEYSGFPADDYIDIPWGAYAGFTYTAPADGWLTAAKTTTSAGAGGLHVKNETNGLRTSCYPNATAGCLLWLYIPMAQGQTVTIDHNATSAANILRFIPARKVV